MIMIREVARPVRNTMHVGVVFGPFTLWRASSRKILHLLHNEPLVFGATGAIELAGTRTLVTYFAAGFTFLIVFILPV